jgi:hypothetical protein
VLLTLLQSTGIPPEPPQDDPGGGSRSYVGIAAAPRRKIDEELEAILASLLLLT